MEFERLLWITEVVHYNKTKSNTPIVSDRKIELSNYKSAEEAEQEYIECMGEPLGKLFNALWQEVAYLHRKWAEYVELFGTKPSRIELLNKSAPYFFRIVQDSLWEQTLLHIARLTDPPKSGGKENLSIQKLPSLLDTPETKQEVSVLVESAIRASEFARDWRNRRIAHRDLKLATKESVEPLELASRAKVKEAIDSIAEVLNGVTKHYQHQTTLFHAGRSPGGANALLYVIDDGLRAENERRARVERGEYRDEDFGPRNL